LKYATMRHRTMPDFASSIRSGVVSLHEACVRQQRVIDDVKSQIAAQEGVDLKKLGREIQSLQVAIDNCNCSESAFSEQRRSYRAEGMTRCLAVHGIALLILSRKIKKVRREKSGLADRRYRLQEIVDRRNSFDFAERNDLLKRHEAEMDSLRKRYLEERGRLESFNRKMSGVVSRLSEAVERLNSEVDKYNVLSRYNAELSAARDKYARFKVHRECEARFGSGAVGSLRSGVLSQIKRLNACCDDLSRKAEAQAQTVMLLERL